jgi:cell division protein FtsA
MIGGGRIVVGVDVGSTKTCAVIAESGPATNGSTAPLTVHGVGLVESEGMSGATVTNLEAATASIRSAVQEAELMAGKEVESAYVGVAGTHVSVSTSRGVVAIGGAEVGPKDVQRVEEVGRAIVLGRDAELIHALCQDYTVDGRSGIEDPLGMAATRLESEVCIVTASTAVCTDLRKAVDRAGYRPAELVVEPLASSLAVLGDQEREAGVVLIEIGGANTDVIAFEGRRIHYLRSLPWGASSVNKDIAKGLGVPEDEALRLKREHGIALRSMVGASEHVEVSGPAFGTGRRVSRELLAHIVEQRLDEILGLAYEELDEAGLLDRLGSGVVLTGGGASLPGTVELARSVFNLPVRLGEPGARLSGTPDALRRPEFAAGVGLALYGSMKSKNGHSLTAWRVLSRFGEWLRDFF